MTALLITLNRATVQLAHLLHTHLAPFRFQLNLFVLTFAVRFILSSPAADFLQRLSGFYHHYKRFSGTKGLTLFLFVVLLLIILALWNFAGEGPSRSSRVQKYDNLVNIAPFDEINDDTTRTASNNNADDVSRPNVVELAIATPELGIASSYDTPLNDQQATDVSRPTEVDRAKATPASRPTVAELAKATPALGLARSYETSLNDQQAKDVSRRRLVELTKATPALGLARSYETSLNDQQAKDASRRRPVELTKAITELGITSGYDTSLNDQQAKDPICNVAPPDEPAPSVNRAVPSDVDQLVQGIGAPNSGMRSAAAIGNQEDLRRQLENKSRRGQLLRHKSDNGVGINYKYRPLTGRTISCNSSYYYERTAPLHAEDDDDDQAAIFSASCPASPCRPIAYKACLSALDSLSKEEVNERFSEFANKKWATIRKPRPLCSSGLPLIQRGCSTPQPVYSSRLPFIQRGFSTPRPMH